ncbi:hypothetical protein [Deinococcus sonorensis]|uniref:Protein kinase domain-containing protein n=2 Tax=Deinococcus sonorensis TaxID=309891 RepID=A0AAU7UGC9_9DEIO
MTQLALLDGQGRPVALDQPLGVGGQGTVYRVRGQPQLVAKVYLNAPSRRDVQKLEAQVQACRPDVLSISAWPSALLRDRSGSIQGLLMPLVSPDEYREIHDLFGPASRRKYFPGTDWSFLVHVARNVARAFAVMHLSGHVVGDVSSRNLMVSPQGTVRLIDTDSFQIRWGQQVFPCPVGTADTTPPELQGQRFGTFVRDANHDLFGLAVMIFQLLFQGRHPYSGVHASGATPTPAEAIRAHQFAYARQPRGVQPPPQTLTLSDLTPEVARLFERAFAPEVRGRPSAGEWDRALAKLARSLTGCPQDISHRHVRGQRCPWCATTQAATTKSRVSAGAKRLDVVRELNRVWQGLQALGMPAAPAPVTAPLLLPVLPLSVPAAPVLQLSPPPPQRLQAARTRRFTAVLLLGGASALLWYSAPLWMALGLALLAWLLFSTNGPRQVKAAHERALRAQHRQALNTHRHEHRALVRQLQADITSLEARLETLQGLLQTDSAVAKYRAALPPLEAQRARILALAAEEQPALDRLVEQHREAALAQYLKRQPLTAGLVNGIGPSSITALHRAGVRTAYDIGPQVRYVPGIGQRRARDLLEWRRAQTQFFQFNPAQVPPADVAQLQQTLDHQAGTLLQQLSTDIARVAADLHIWRQVEAATAQQARQVLGDIEQRRHAIARLEGATP